ncbi:hypothetical protein B0H14DRAFT_2255752, partial [Mycena olivaceomarginata]
FGPQRGEGADTQNPPDEDTNVEEHIQAEQHPQIRHDAVEVPDHKNPFSDHPVVECTFLPLLTDLIRQDIIPAGYGMLPEEWDEDSYPDVEILYMGRQMKMRMHISLAYPIWAQQARLWVQGLRALS